MFLFNKINLGIELIKTAVKTSNVIEQIKLLPWVMITMAFLFGGFVLFVVIYAFSCGSIITIDAKTSDVIDGGKVKTIDYNNLLRYLLFFDISMFLYWIACILGFNDLIISYSISIWYFTKKKDTVTLPIKRIIKDVLKYHLGTVFKVSLLVPVFRILQKIFGFITVRLKNASQDSRLVRFFTTACVCCIHMYQRFLRYLSKHTYVQVALWSQNYKQSSQKAYFLLERNKEKIKHFDFIQEFLLFQIKICCSLLSAFIIYIFLTFSPVTIFGRSLKEMEAPLAPSLFVLFVAYFYAAIFVGSFNIEIKSIIQCYLLDTEMFIGEQRYVEPIIKDFMDMFAERDPSNLMQVYSKLPEKNNRFTKENPYDKDGDNEKFKIRIKEGNDSDDDIDEEDLDLNTEENRSNIGRPESRGLEGFSQRPQNQIGFIGNPLFVNNDANFTIDRKETTKKVNVVTNADPFEFMESSNSKKKMLSKGNTPRNKDFDNESVAMSIGNISLKGDSRLGTPNYDLTAQLKKN